MFTLDIGNSGILYMAETETKVDLIAGFAETEIEKEERTPDRVLSKETKQRMSEKAKGRVPWNKGLKLKNRKKG